MGVCTNLNTVISLVFLSCHFLGEYNINSAPGSITHAGFDLNVFICTWAVFENAEGLILYGH